MIPKKKTIQKLVIVDSTVNDNLKKLSDITKRSQSELINSLLKKEIKNNISQFKEYCLIDFFQPVIAGNLDSLEIHLTNLNVTLKTKDDDKETIFLLESTVNDIDSNKKIFKDVKELEKYLMMLTMYIGEQDNIFVKNYLDNILKELDF